MAISAKTITVRMVFDSRDATRGIQQVERQFDNLEKRGQTAAFNIGGAFRAIVGAAVVREVFTLADSFQTLQNRLAAITGSQQDAAAAFQNIKRIAEETRSPINEIGDLYSKLTIATQDAGVSAEEVAQMTTTFAKALQLSGVGAQQAQSAILQFGQAMASGRLQGDEFRSLMENSPVFMRKLSDALGRPIGDLKKLASEGVITADIIRLAMQEMAPEVETEFDRMQTTLGQSFTLIGNNFMEMMANIEAQTGIFQGIANLIKLISENTKIFAAIAAVAFGAGVVRAIRAVVSAYNALKAAVAAAGFAQATLLALGGPAGIAALAAGVVAAGAAYYALSEMMDANNAKIAEETALAEAQNQAAVELAETKKGQAAAALAASEAEKTRAKAEKEAADDAKRAAEQREKQIIRNIQRTRESIAQLQVETQALAERLQLDIDLVGVAEDYAEQKNRVFDIENERAKKIAEISALEYSSNPVRNAEMLAERLREVNAQYDKQITQLDQLILRRIKEEEISGIRNVSALTRSTAATLSAIQAEFDARTKMFDFERTYAVEIDRIRSEAADKEARLREESEGMDQRLFDQKLANIYADRDARLAAANQVFQVEQQNNEVMRSASEGIRQAQQEALARVTDDAAYAKQIFNTVMDGFTNSILKFVETGKLSFKDLFKSLMTEIIKMQANKLFLSLFGQGGLFGNALSGIFGGARAMGGPVDAGKTYLVGERGPELVRFGQAGQVIPNSRIMSNLQTPPQAATQVVYNIQAVDAMSFKQLVARDPEFIYSVTQAGARRLPR